MNKSIAIMKMTEKDIDEIYEIELEAFEAEPWPKEWFVDALKDSEAYYFVALYGGRLAGFAGMHHNANQNPPYSKIATLAVKKEFRRKGIGRALMTELLENGKRLNLQRTKLEVDTRSFAVKFYEDLGFEIQDFQENYYEKANGDAYIMWRYERE